MIYNFCFHSTGSDITTMIKNSGGKHRPHFDCLMDAFFSSHRNKSFRMLVLGEDNPNNLLVWLTYFPKADIHTENEIGNTYDVIFVEEGVNSFSGWETLCPGGVFISYNNTSEIDVPSDFTTLRFRLSHDNCPDKAHILWARKPGLEIFPSPNKLTLITPCCRPNNLPKIMESLPFEHIYKWVIVYDGKKVHPMIQRKARPHPQIQRATILKSGVCGNPERNFALDLIKKDTNVSFLYFLDDDNIVHPDLFPILPFFRRDAFYTFNQHNRTRGDSFKIGEIDTANYIVDYPFVGSHRWDPFYPPADGKYIETIYHEAPSKWIFIDNDLAYYNHLRPGAQ